MRASASVRGSNASNARRLKSYARGNPLKPSTYSPCGTSRSCFADPSMLKPLQLCSSGIVSFTSSLYTLQEDIVNILFRNLELRQNLRKRAGELTNQH